MMNRSGGSFKLLRTVCSGKEVHAGRGRNEIKIDKSYNIIQIFVTRNT